MNINQSLTLQFREFASEKLSADTRLGETKGLMFSRLMCLADLASGIGAIVESAVRGVFAIISSPFFAVVAAIRGIEGGFSQKGNPGEGTVAARTLAVYTDNASAIKDTLSTLVKSVVNCVPNLIYGHNGSDE